MAAELQPPTQSAYAQNLAPLKPLLELKRGGRKPDSYIAKAVKERFDHKMRKDRDVWREIHNVGQLTNLMINGKQYLIRNPIDGSWGALPLKGANQDQRALNILNNIKTNLLGKWENSSPDIVIRPGRNLDTCVSAAKAADTVNNYYERQFYDHFFTQQEGLMGMTFGTYIDRYRYDADKCSMSVVQEIFETKDTQFGSGFGYCADCEHVDSDSRFKSAMGGTGPMARASCPECYSTAVEILDAPMGQLSSAVGKREQQHGDLACELLPLPACRWDLARRPEDSNWFIYNQEIPKGAVDRVLGNVLLPADDLLDDTGLATLRALQKQGAALAGYSAHGDIRDKRDKSDTVTFNEMWLSPDDYADINLIGNEETVDGPPLPKGKLIDVFPDGLCAVGLNGMSVVLALYPERHRNHIVSGAWFMQAQTGAGRGLADSVEIQKIFNTMNNQALQYMTSTYTPAIGYDQSIWSGSRVKYIGTPRTNIPFDLTKLPEGRKLHDSIYQFQPTAMPSQFFNFAQNFMNILMQKTSGASDFQIGEQGITQNPTATAAEIDQGNADAFNQPIFLIKADARRRGAELTIRLFREHFPMKRYFDLGGEFGEQEGIELAASDVSADLIFGVVPNSEMPQGPYTRRKNRMQFFNAVGGFEGLLMANQSAPKMLAATARDFDVDIELSQSYDAVAIISRKRLNQMQAAEKVGVSDPAILIEAIQPPISTVEPDLADSGKWYATWLRTDQGQNASMPLRNAVEILVRMLVGGQVAQEAELAAGQGQVQAAAMAAPAIGQAALEQHAAQQPESTEPDPTAVLQMQQEQSQQQHEASEGALDREHELKVLESEGKRDKEVAAHDATQKIRIEKAKPAKTTTPKTRKA
jgi:hypothetical protein